MQRGRELKKQWKKPKLIILVKGKPEEAVLENCKNNLHAPLSPGSINMNCESWFCSDCHGEVLS